MVACNVSLRCINNNFCVYYGSYMVHMTSSFIQPLPVFLRGLEVRAQCSQVESGVRQYLHRMVICLGDELLKYVPVAVSLLLTDCKVCVNL